jgi:hypothetical protein
MADNTNAQVFFAHLNESNVVIFNPFFIYPSRGFLIEKGSIQPPYSQRFLYFKNKFNNYLEHLLTKETFLPFEVNDTRETASKIVARKKSVEDKKLILNELTSKYTNVPLPDIRDLGFQLDMSVMHNINLELELLQKELEALQLDLENEFKCEMNRLFEYPLDLGNVAKYIEYEDRSLLACYVNMKIYERLCH